MTSNSIMQDIRNLLSQGRSSREVIQLGYAPGTVYKVQRRLRRTGQPEGQAPVQVRDQALQKSDREEQEGSADDVVEDWWAFFEALENPDPTDTLRSDLDQAQEHIKELEKQVLNLRDRVIALESAANSVGEFKPCDPALPAARQNNNTWSGNSRPNAWDVARVGDMSSATSGKG
jgi:hypothetical protein